jgi:cysteine desulfurase
MIYLDYNATTPIDGDVQKAIGDALHIYGNPSSNHRTGMTARERLEWSRTSVSDLIGAEPDEIIFTSGGTEANNLALVGLARSLKKGHIISTIIEHPSVINPLKYLQDQGFSVTFIGTDKKGMVNPEDIVKLITDDTVLISVMHSNNETGVIQPIREIAHCLEGRNIIFHSDAAQSVGKIPLSVKDLSVDMLTVVSHKFYGPKGVGALFIKKGTEVKPILHGAGQEKGFRPGTENIIGIIGLGKASEIAGRDMEKCVSHVTDITATLYRKLRDRISDIRLNGEGAPGLPNTLNISMRGISGIELVELLSEDVAFSTGAACHSGVSLPSEVLLAMGISAEDALSSVRISTGKDTSLDEIHRASEIIADAVKKLRKEK